MQREEFAVDLSPMICQWSLMARAKYIDATATPRAVSASVLEALGKGLLIATASVVAGLWFGTVNAAAGMWAIGLVATGGIACTVGSVLVKHMRCGHYERKTGGSPDAANASKVTAPTPAVEAAEDIAPEEFGARRRVMDRQQREPGASRGGVDELDSPSSGDFRSRLSGSGSNGWDTGR